MTEQEIIEIANATLIEEFELDPEVLTPEAHFADDLGLDSLDAVDMVVALEQAFGYKFRDNDAMRNIRQLCDLHAYLIQRCNEEQAAQNISDIFSEASPEKE